MYNCFMFDSVCAHAHSRITLLWWSLRMVISLGVEQMNDYGKFILTQTLRIWCPSTLLAAVWYRTVNHWCVGLYLPCQQYLVLSAIWQSSHLKPATCILNRYALYPKIFFWVYLPIAHYLLVPITKYMHCVVLYVIVNTWAESYLQILVRKSIHHHPRASSINLNAYKAAHDVSCMRVHTHSYTCIMKIDNISVFMQKKTTWLFVCTRIVLLQTNDHLLLRY